MSKNEAFSVWINGHFLKWEQQQGKRQTIKAFAKFLDVQYILLSAWMAGNKEPSDRNSPKLAIKLGGEIYDVLSVKKSTVDPMLIEVAHDWDNLSIEQQREILAEVRKLANR